MTLLGLRGGMPSSADCRLAHRSGAVLRHSTVIRLGLRLTFSGGREAVTRLVILAAAVGIGVGLLLTAVSAVNAVGAQNDRYAWLDTGGKNLLQTAPRGRHGVPAAPAASGSVAGRDPLWGLVTTDEFNGQTIDRADVAATGPASPVPPGISRDPRPGEYYASPALSALLRSTPAGELADRYPRAPGGPHRRCRPAVPRLADHHRRPARRADVAPTRRRGGNQPQHHFAQQLRCRQLRGPGGPKLDRH